MGAGKVSDKKLLRRVLVEENILNICFLCKRKEMASLVSHRFYFGVGGGMVQGCGLVMKGNFRRDS